MSTSNSNRWKPPSSSAELDALVQRITSQVVAEFGSLASIASTIATAAPWPLAELLNCEPDRIGALPAWSFSDAPGSRIRADRPPQPADGARALASIIDHTLLKPDVTPQQIVALCEDASEQSFRTVCVNPCHVALAARELGRGRRGDAAPGVCAVVGFPLGATLSDVKAFEARRAVEEGATEIDMVLAIGLLKAQRDGYVVADIAAVVRAVPRGTIVKVILETCLLTEAEKRQACRLAREAGASYVKTSTGFSTGGATPADVRLMREEVGRALGVKASGGIRTVDDAWTMVLSGATRLGASASVAIVSGATSSAHSGY